MRFHVEYKDNTCEEQVIHLISKTHFDALNEMQELARHLTTNRINEWCLVSRKDGVIYE